MTFMLKFASGREPSSFQRHRGSRLWATTHSRHRRGQAARLSFIASGREEIQQLAKTVRMVKKKWIRGKVQVVTSSASYYAVRLWGGHFLFVNFITTPPSSLRSNLECSETGDVDLKGSQSYTTHFGFKAGLHSRLRWSIPEVAGLHQLQLQGKALRVRKVAHEPRCPFIARTLASASATLMLAVAIQRVWPRDHVSPSPFLLFVVLAVVSCSLDMNKETLACSHSFRWLDTFGARWTRVAKSAALT